VTRIIQIVKSVFNQQAGETKEKEKEKGAKVETTKAQQKGANAAFSQALNTTEYRLIFEFFLAELPKLVLKVCKLDPEEDFLRKHFSLKQYYAGTTPKTEMLMKTYSSNYNKLL